MQKLIGIILSLGLVALVLSACNATNNQANDAPGAAPVAPTVEVGAEVEAPAGLTIFTIDPSASQARFELDEELRGQPKTVVGLTNQVAGEIALDLNDLSTAEVGQIVIDAGSFSTDSSLRNRTIRDRILNAGDFTFITFTPTAVRGLPAVAQPGDEITFTIDGDLTIREVTQPVSFEVTATVDGANQISGTAGTVINRADFDLVIPSVPNVANVEEAVELYLDFVATGS